jgi:hypothetical protein
MPNPVDVSHPAVRDLLQRLLGREEVTEVRIVKGTFIELGVVRRGFGPRWFPGATVFSALLAAEDALTPKAPVAVPELP